MIITKDTSIEDLVRELPESVRYLMQQGIKCIACGEPTWGTLESASREKGFSDEQIAGFVRELRIMHSGSPPSLRR
jgi:methionine synthase II (cobalamin-independent)